MQPTRLEVKAASGPYPVVIGPRTIASLPRLIDAVAPGGRRFLVSSPVVWELHEQAFSGVTKEPVILVPDGEKAKNTMTVARVYEALIKANADRASVIVAVGGGVIGDMVGFAAATYLRGVRLVQVPTTLLAQVDSSVGGKVGVNHTLGKNLIGAFHPPALVVCDPVVLTTLPRREFRAGLYEVVKYGVISDAALFHTLGDRLKALFDRDEHAVSEIVAASCRIKADVVASDERESGLRRILNFGHTLGHALEAVTKYKRFLHGEAVAYGMLAAAAIGVARGVTPPDVQAALATLIAKLGPLPPVADLSIKEVIAAAGHDKKIVAGTLHFVASTGLGSTTILTDVTAKEMRAALRVVGLRRA